MPKAGFRKKIFSKKKLIVRGRLTSHKQFLFGKLINYKVHPSKKCPKSVENILVFPRGKKNFPKIVIVLWLYFFLFCYYYHRSEICFQETRNKRDFGRQMGQQ